MATTFLYATDYGVQADNSTDDTAAWQAAITALKNLNSLVSYGGILLAPAGVSIISSTLDLDFSGAKLVGMGRGAYHDTVPLAPAATTLKWAGSSGGEMLRVGPDTGSTGSGITDWAVIGIHLDSGYLTSGTAAGTGLEIVSASHGAADVFCTEFGTQGVIIHTQTGLTESQNSSHNTFAIRGRQLNTAGVICRVTGIGVSNSCFNRFTEISGEFSSAIALDCGDCDNNTFEQVYLQHAGSSPTSAIVLDASGPSGVPGACRNNTFEHVSTSVNITPILAQGTENGMNASGPNWIIQFDQSNSSPDFEIGTGAILYWGTNTTPPGLQAYNNGQYGGYRTTEDDFSIVWGSTSALQIGVPNPVTFPSGVFKNYVTSITATPLGYAPSRYSIGNLTTSGFSIYTEDAADYFVWRAEGFRTKSRSMNGAVLYSCAG